MCIARTLARSFIIRSVIFILFFFKKKKGVNGRDTAPWRVASYHIECIVSYPLFSSFQYREEKKRKEKILLSMRSSTRKRLDVVLSKEGIRRGLGRRRQAFLPLAHEISGRPLDVPWRQSVQNHLGQFFELGDVHGAVGVASGGLRGGPERGEGSLSSSVVCFWLVGVFFYGEGRGGRGSGGKWQIIGRRKGIWKCGCCYDV